jgi:arylformamidase
LLVSGIFDLAPLLFTSQKMNLNLDEEQAQKQSPVRRELRIDSPLLVASGELESAEFNRQSDLCAQVFDPQCRGLERYVARGRNHFEIVDELADPGSLLFGKALALIKR